jgi:hypothetical protein
MMRSFAAFVVKGRLQAIGVVAVTALLALFLPPLAYISGGTVALITLRMGPRQGLQLVFGAVLALGLLGLLLMQNPLAGVVFALLFWLPVWALANSLRRTMLPGRSVLLAGLFGMMVVAGFGFGSADPVAWWQQAMQHSMAPVLDGVPQAEQQQMLQLIGEIAPIMAGTSAMLLSLSLILSLFIGRWWQAMLYNPGGFGEEFRQLRLGKNPAMLLLLLLLAAGFSGNAFLAQNLPLVVLLPFLLQGLALLHGLVRQHKANAGWLVGTYLLLFVTGPMALLLAVAGVVDNWFDFRTFFGPKGGPDDA